MSLSNEHNSPFTAANNAAASSTSTTTTSSTTSSPSATTTATTTIKEEADANGRFLLLHKQVIYNKDVPNNLSLPSMDHVLKGIESYQNQQQLNDSQLLLEFNQRNSQSDEAQSHSQSPPYPQYNQEQHPSFSAPPPQQQQQQQGHHPQYTFQQRSESTNSIDAFQSELKQEQQQSLYPQIPPNYNLQHQQQQSQIPTSYNNTKPSLSQRPSTIHRKSSTSSMKRNSASTTPLSISTSINNLGDLDDFERDSSVDSGLESPNLTPGGSNKKRTNLPRETIEILNEWILNNMDNPYPNHTQKRLLLEQTGLSNVQLSNWFINKRRRRLFSNLSGNNGQPIKKKRLIDRL